MDVNNPQDIEQAFTKITEDSGYLNCLINNAGFAAMGPVSELSTENLAQQFFHKRLCPSCPSQGFFSTLTPKRQRKQPKPNHQYRLDFGHINDAFSVLIVPPKPHCTA